MIEGCDYAYGAPISPSALTRAGKRFVGRYCVGDLAPPGRGISAAEYANLASSKIDTFVYWESREAWMLDGFDAGVHAANDGQANLTAAGMPNQPIYFAHDIEPDPAHYAAIDDTLAGAAATIGLELVGIYGGRHIIDHCRDAGTATWFAQAEAWSFVDGELIVADGVHLLQYDSVSGATIGGVSVDLVRALVDHYGQSADYIIVPSQFAPADLPSWYAKSLKQPRPSDADVNGIRWYVARRNVRADHDTYRYSRPDVHSAYSGEPVTKGERLFVERVFTDANDVGWGVTEDSFIPLSRYSPRITIAKRPRR